MAFFSPVDERTNDYQGDAGMCLLQAVSEPPQSFSRTLLSDSPHSRPPDNCTESASEHNMPDLTFIHCDPDDPRAQALLSQLGETLARITGSSGTASFDNADVRVPRARFVVAVDRESCPVGCGALRPLSEDVAEVKRMFAVPGSAAGVGAALLAHLEAEAREIGYRAIWLETRAINSRAVGFYLRNGYARIENYGKYAGRPEAVCFGKSIQPPASTAGSE
ncbi:acyl-CoA N-acyltransferase [Zopfochytrium polystomum]|nr:acyl-CoA N-acyltransferase [Zopfochytrium polystomum]